MTISSVLMANAWHLLKVSPQGCSVAGTGGEENWGLSWLQTWQLKDPSEVC